MNINQRIKDLRKSKNISQRDLAIKMGVAQPTINYFENRDKDLTINQIEQISEALGVSVKELLFDEKEDKTDNNALILELDKEISLLKREIDLLQRELKISLLDSEIGTSSKKIYKIIIENMIKGFHLLENLAPKDILNEINTSLEMLIDIIDKE